MPQSNSYHDVNGNPIQVDSGSAPPQVQTSYHDANGNPIDPNHPFIPSSLSSTAEAAQAGGGQTPQGAPYFGKLLAQIPPLAGSMIEPGLGTVAGSAISTLMKGAAPGFFGQPPQNIGEFAKNLGVDLLTNEGIPRFFSKMGKGIANLLPAVKEGTAKVLTDSIRAQQAGRTESAILEDAANQAADKHTGLGGTFDPKSGEFVNPAQEANSANLNTAYQDLAKAKQAHLDATNEFNNTPKTISQETVQHGPKNFSKPNLVTQVPNPAYPIAKQKLADAKAAFGDAQQTFSKFPLADENEVPQALQDAFGQNTTGKQLLKLKAAMNAGKDVASSQEFSPITNKVFSDLQNVRNAKLVVSGPTVAELGYRDLLGGEGKLDAAGILDKLGKKSEIYSEAFGDGLPAFKEAMGEIAKQQKIGPAGRLLNYAGHHLIWTAVATGGVGLVSHPAGAVAGGAVLTNAMFGKLMSSEYAPVVVAALKTPAGNPNAAVINEFLSAAIKSVGGAAQAAEAK